jgi:FkbM family methyltransferase
MGYSVTDVCAGNSFENLRSFALRHEKLVLFGAEKNGEYISHFLNFAEFPAECFVDNNPATIGSELNGLQIKSVNILLDQQYGIVVTSERYADPILMQLDGMGIGRDRIHVLSQGELQRLFDKESQWPAYIVKNYYSNYYKDYFKKNDINVEAAYLAKKIYKFPNVFLQPIDYQISFFSEIVDYVLPAMCEDYSMLVEGPGEYGSVVVKPEDVVFDCGANIGLFSMLAAAKGGRVYAFEPVPSVFQHLDKAKEIYSDIHISDYALSDKTGIVKIALSNGTNTANSFVLPVSDMFIEVNTISIDEFVSCHQLERVDFIKADIEGAERLMLAGAVETLKKFAPKLSVCTYHLPDDKEVLEAIIMAANSNYIVEHRWQKLYAYVPE